MSIQTVVFDFGNVLGCFDHRLASSRLARYTDLSADEVHARLFGGSLESDYECGRLSTEEFVQQACAACGLHCGEDQFIADYNDIFWPNPETCELIPSLARRFRLLLLSNTNELHLRRFRPMFAATLRHFAALLFSHEVGVRKPDLAIFAAAQKQAACAPDECLFFDDLAANVEAARSFGWQAVQFHGAADVLVAVEERMRVQ